MSLALIIQEACKSNDKITPFLSKALLNGTDEQIGKAFKRALTVGCSAYSERLNKEIESLSKNDPYAARNTRTRNADMKMRAQSELSRLVKNMEDMGLEIECE